MTSKRSWLQILRWFESLSIKGFAYDVDERIEDGPIGRLPFFGWKCPEPEVRT